jgi:ATP/maltotriose-dependent transcriptional regulator MalT
MCVSVPAATVAPKARKCSSITGLNRSGRAAQWHERNGQPAEALGYWMKAGEADRAARLVGSLAFPAYQQGRVAAVE